ncbi:Hsp90 chaperone protein kinase-targeting subunit [Intoshia linei]|uniref:Hsp90 chaperone protein kinase-targeting subunit n=1 Tax=Intoshia linei TaxID=1819745 RepID=A0A177AUH9_9BILA|nr:Hsp90 chaperone protein kinase-targeting subunit [Intoshia linei]
MALNYSKWDHIDISDDEDDTHPNVDTPSLFRWRHKARIEKMVEFDKEMLDFNGKYDNYIQKMNELKLKIKNGNQNNETQLNKWKKELEEAESHKQSWVLKRHELEKKKRLQPLNIDTICKDSTSKTFINKEFETTLEENYQNQSDFMNKYKDDIEKFGMYRKYDDSRKFLLDNSHLLCEYTSNYIVLWCLNLALEEKHALMEHVAHQATCLQFMFELSKTANIPPVQCINGFFDKLKMGDSKYLSCFNSELESYINRIRKRAQEKIEVARAEEEEEDRKNRLGPGGLDPVEVFKSLPPDLQQCFENKDIEMIKDVMSKLPPSEAEYHLRRYKSTILNGVHGSLGPSKII